MVEDMIVFAEHGEEARSDAVTLLYVSDGEAEISFPSALPDGGMKAGNLVPGDLLFLAPGVEYKLQTSGQVISISLTSPPPLPEDGNVLADFFSAPSGFLLFRTGNDPFLREDFQRILREGQDRRPFHQEIIRNTLAQDFCLLLRNYTAEAAA